MTRERVKALRARGPVKGRRPVRIGEKCSSLTVYAPISLQLDVDALAKENGVSAGEIIRRALRIGVATLRRELRGK